MNIYDCFMYFDEDLILDIRLNTLDKFVDYFVIVESTSTHSGEKNELKFDIKKYKDFKDKIIPIKKKLNFLKDDIFKEEKKILKGKIKKLYSKRWLYLKL